MLSNFLQLSERIWTLPVIHGSGDFAIEVRRVMLAQEFDCLAVPLPPSFQEDVELAVAELPNLALVVQPEPMSFQSWQPENSESDDEDAADEFASQSGGQQELKGCSYVPIDPCQPVIAALRIALQERMPRAFIDLETANFVSLAAFYPDPYPVKQVSIDRFAAALLPTVPRIPEGQPEARVVWMANRLHELEERHQRILFVCSMMDWPWVKDAYHDCRVDLAEEEDVEPTEAYANDPQTHLFWLGELPFITGLYEQARQSLDDDENLSIDGVKTLLLAARDRYRHELKSRARKITPKMLRTFLHYVRNLCLIERRMTPDLYSLILAAKQIAGDQFAITLAEVAREYGQESEVREPRPPVLRMTNGVAQLPDGDVVHMKSRLPGQALVWRSLEARIETEAAEDRPGSVAAALESISSVLMAGRGCRDRELSDARQRCRTGNARSGSRPHGKVLDQPEGWARHSRDAAELAHGRAVREGLPADARDARLRADVFRFAGRPARLSVADHLDGRASRRIDAGSVRDRLRPRDGRPWHWSRELWRCDVSV
ncbi:MAG: hypothetical protein FD138_3034, partial [Planctomycetota bacterium]